MNKVIIFALTLLLAGAHIIKTSAASAGVTLEYQQYYGLTNSTGTDAIWAGPYLGVSIR